MSLPKTAIILTLVFIAGCGDSATPRSVGIATSPSQKSATAELLVGDTVAGLRVPELLQANGTETISFDEIRGSTVVLEFWATWCAPCVAAIPHLNEIADEFSNHDNVRFISITDEGSEIVAEFLAIKPMHTWIGIDESRSLMTAFGVSTIPQTVVINPDGKVAAKIYPSELSSALLTRIENGEILETKTPGPVIVAAPVAPQRPNP